jgi:response regulator RpfG family c-di-GMP phosphodiesterase
MTDETALETPNAQEVPPALLFVDDESNILRSLKRLFYPAGYRIFTAESGEKGLEILRSQPIDLVISDMRMPEMSGAQFLEQVCLHWPDTIRILLTGYADIQSTIAAINAGQIYRYLSKPWDDKSIVWEVRRALEHKQLERDKLRLESLAIRQNEELKRLNTSLEAKVKARTEELSRAMDDLQHTHKELKETFMTTVRVFSNFIELRKGPYMGHSRRVAEDAKRLATRLQLNDNDVQNIVFAALLHDIGGMALPDRILTKPFDSLTPDDKELFKKHPATGQATLMGLEHLKETAQFVRSHHENYDGSGYPDHLAGTDIPLGARILSIANDYDGLQIGIKTYRRYTQADAKLYLLDQRGKRYDPFLVDTFIAMLKTEEGAAGAGKEYMTSSKQLRPGMVISRDVVSKDGLLLLSKGFVVDETIIEQLRNVEETLGHPFAIYIRINLRKLRSE